MYVLQLDMEPLYDLCAVLIHHGPSASSGHYIAVIKDPVSGHTYKFNDTEVEKEKKFSIVNEEDPGSNLIYIVTYTVSQKKLSRFVFVRTSSNFHKFR